ncbi:MAG: aldo/keto reductase [Spirochaetaceae bacterium]|jgi:predicted aldo/keto reductase-like oxidoreductase|nr:aldo/keto reductase [Spirochaetaceae bacterium]
MQFRPYGSTGRMISILGISTTAFSEKKELDNYSSSIVHAFEKGVNYFDSAPFSQNGIGEMALSQAVVEMKKTGHPFNLASRTMATNSVEFMDDLEKTLRLLNVDTIDFYQLWRIFSEDQLRSGGDSSLVHIISKAVSEGLIRHPVLSTNMGKIDLIHLVKDMPFEGITLGHSAIRLLFNNAVINSFTGYNLGLAVQNPFGTDFFESRQFLFDFIRTSTNQTFLEASLHFFMSNDYISTVVTKLSTPYQIDQAISAVDHFEQYSEEEINANWKRMKDELLSFRQKGKTLSDVSIKETSILTDAVEFLLGPKKNNE